MADMVLLNSVQEYEHLKDFIEAYKKLRNNPAGYTFRGEPLNDLSKLKNEEDLLQVIAENHARLGYTTANPHNDALRGAIKSARTLSGNDNSFGALNSIADNGELFEKSFASFKDQTQALINSQTAQYAEESAKLFDSKLENKKLKSGIFRSRVGKFVLAALAIAAAPALLFGAAGIVGGFAALFSVAHLGTLALAGFTGFLGYHFLKNPFKKAMDNLTKKIEKNQKALAGTEKGSNKELAEQLTKVNELESQLGFTKSKMVSKERQQEVVNENNTHVNATENVASNMVNVNTLNNSNESERHANYYTANMENSVDEFKKYITTEERERAITDAANAYVENKINEMFAGSTSTVSDVDRKYLKEQVAGMMLDYVYADAELIKNGNEEETKKLVGSPISYKYENNGEMVPATFEFSPADLVREVVKSEQVENSIKECKENIDKFARNYENTKPMAEISHEDKVSHAESIVEEKLKDNAEFKKLSPTQKQNKIRVDAAYIVDIMEKQDKMYADEYSNLSKTYGTNVIDILNAEIEEQYDEAKELQNLHERMNDIADEKIGKVATEAKAKIANEIGDKEQIFNDLMIEKLAKDNNLNPEELRKLLFDTEAAKNYQVTQVHIVDGKGKNTDKTISLSEIATKMENVYPEIKKQIEVVEASWKNYEVEMNKVLTDEQVAELQNAGVVGFNNENIPDLRKQFIVNSLRDKFELDDKTVEKINDNIPAKRPYYAKGNYNTQESIDSVVDREILEGVFKGSYTTESSKEIVAETQDMSNSQIEQICEDAEQKREVTKHYSKEKRVVPAIVRVVNGLTIENGKEISAPPKQGTEEIIKFNRKRKYAGYEDFNELADPKSKNAASATKKDIKKKNLKERYIEIARPKTIQEYMDGSVEKLSDEDVEFYTAVDEEVGKSNAAVESNIQKFKSAPKRFFSWFANKFGKVKAKGRTTPTRESEDSSMTFGA